MQCLCPKFYNGSFCEQSTSRCDVDNPCENNSTCIVDYHRHPFYMCNCLPGWKGPNCQEEVDECKTKPC